MNARENLFSLREELESELKDNILPWWMGHMPPITFSGDFLAM